MWKARHESGEQFSWVDPPTAGLEPITRDRIGTNGLARFKVLNAFRPWWISHRYIPEDERPVSIAAALMWLAGLLTGGLVLLVTGLRATGLVRESPAILSRRAEFAPAETLD